MFQKSIFTEYLVTNVVLSVVFGVLYYLSDVFMDRYADFATMLHLGKIKKVDQFMDHFHFSCITQSTVGFANSHFDANTTESKPFRFLNYLQLFSIFAVAGYYFT